MIPRKHLWRKQVQLSMHESEIKLLDELADLDYRAWGGRRNRSSTVIHLVKQELKRRRAEDVAIMAGDRKAIKDFLNAPK